MEKIEKRLCRKCGQKEVKVKITENDDEMTLEISKCQNCNYQNGLKELSNG